ncbi:hypothetical protein JVT61DRAFT_7985 [Boletus reticuloceps]|uniref:DUF4139 domain-containing protein n=1 Tax=Boletus reticuloceps TaxID=495285 RepID=A0A8I2YI52_9AGAM|nr:hypothetical protein JVT61DRAFT_7985 [Boletus reticuloceps]
MVTSSAKALSQNTTVIEADQIPIKAVKLFQSSGSAAKITRTFPLSFLRSQNEAQVVEIVHLPASVQSVDVSITSTSGSVTILDHYHTSITDVQKPPIPVTTASQALRELETERLRLEDEKRVRQQSFTFLTTYMDSLAQCKSQGQPEAAQMVTFFDEFVEIGITRSAAIAELDGKLADISNKIREETERLSKLSSDLPVKVVTVISCTSQVSVEAAELTVSYVVKQVSWKPAYDLHIAMTGNTPSPTVTLDFRCTVTQWTGENWENISLALTTANQVLQLIRLPEPKKIDISLRPSNVFHQPTNAFHRPANAPQAALFGAPAAPLSRSSVLASATASIDIPGQRPPNQAPIAQLANFPPGSPTTVVVETPEAEAPSQGVSQLISHDSKDPITHTASGNLFIPSDHAEHHVLVDSLSLRAEFMRVVVPGIDNRVYYTCEVKNTSEYVLLPGTVKTYLNDKHVSSTDIHNTELPQILECSLAVDTGVKALHNRASDALPQSVPTFTSKAMTTYTSATVLHNTYAEPIRGVIVRSSIPLPADPRITIVLKEPAGLAEIDEGSVTVKEGCLARWSTTGGRKGKQAGLFEWVCDMNPGTEVLKAVWEVCAPQHLELLEQVRP